MSPLVQLAAELLAAAVEAAQKSGEEAAEVERQALIKAARTIAIERARREFQG